ncbi:MAG: carbohydrate ABC transporter permease [Lachnospiraceae bacterium]
MSRKNKEAVQGIIYILPSFLLILIFCIIPIFMSAYFSFTDYNIMNPPEFAGLDNYVQMFKDEYVTAAVKNTLLYVLMTVPFQTIISLAFAGFIAQEARREKRRRIPPQRDVYPGNCFRRYRRYHLENYPQH